MQPHAAVELLFILGQQCRVEPAHVVVRLAAREPGDGGVAGPVDRAVDDLAGDDIHHPDDRLLGAALGQLVGQQVAFLARLPGVEGGEATRIDRHGVEQDPLGAVRVDRPEHGKLLIPGAPHEETAIVAEVGR